MANGLMRRDDAKSMILMLSAMDESVLYYKLGSLKWPREIGNQYEQSMRKVYGQAMELYGEDAVHLAVVEKFSHYVEDNMKPFNAPRMWEHIVSPGNTAHFAYRGFDYDAYVKSHHDGGNHLPDVFSDDAMSSLVRNNIIDFNEYKKAVEFIAENRFGVQMSLNLDEGTRKMLQNDMDTDLKRNQMRNFVEIMEDDISTEPEQKEDAPRLHEGMKVRVSHNPQWGICVLKGEDLYRPGRWILRPQHTQFNFGADEKDIIPVPEKMKDNPLLQGDVGRYLNESENSDTYEEQQFGS